MWTPKRIILLASSFLLFTMVYVLYTFTALGRINTLPPLPDEYRPIDDEDAQAVVRPTRIFQPTPLERKLKQAFGEFCKEVSWPVQLELNPKSMVLAAGKCEVGKDGRIYLEPMSLALFSKKKSEGGEVEINTLRCKEAYIRFDHPVKDFSPSELKDRKVVGAELFGDPMIRITNNHRTARKGDDLEVQISRAPLYYIEKTQLIKTSGHVHLEDGECTFKDGRILPKTTVDAEGMEMELTTAAPPPRSGFFAPPKPKTESITGVKRIVLKEAVTITMFVAGGGPFPGSGKPNGSAATPPREKRPEPDMARSHNRVPQENDPAHIHIATPGRFEYRLFKDHDEAYFDVPNDIEQLTSPQDVTVERINNQAGNIGYDMLVCKHMEMRLKRRNSEKPAAKSAAPLPRGDDQGLEIETVHATGPDVTLTSDAEKLDAHGTDFFHDAAKKQSVLKGVPYMEANKEDSLIQAPELRIQEIVLPVASTPPSARGHAADPPAKTYQQIQAIGPGSIHLTNKNTGKQNNHAYWSESLLSTREGGMDVLVLTGSARFVDDEHEQWLKAEMLKVWLLAEEIKPQAMASPASASAATPLASGEKVVKAAPVSPAGKGVGGEGPNQAGAAKPPAQANTSRRPHRLEARRNVLAHSPDLNIHDAAQLVILFLDVPSSRMPPPNAKGNELPVAEQRPAGTSTNRAPIIAAPPATKAPERAVAVVAPQGSQAPDRSLMVAAPQGSQAPDRAPVVAAPQAPQAPNRSLTVAAQKSPPADPPRPIDLSARSIEAKVLRCDQRMALDHLWAEGGSLDVIDKRGGVVVRQAPAKPGEQGVYIEGNTLDMSCSAEGNVLVVTGDLARLRMDKIFILGPEVNIDQVQNKAWVVGGGAMEMQSATTLEGKPLARSVPLTVHWSDHMFFVGPYAYFFGNIQAEQDQARMACQNLQVVFDKPISLKQGMRGDQPAKVSHLTGDKGESDQDVRVEDQTLEGGQLQKYSLLMGKVIQMVTEPRDDVPPRQGKSNDANRVTLSGPGSVRILQRGGMEMVPTAGKAAPGRPVPANPPSGEQEMKMTYISFEQQMQANSLTNVASFWGAVRVFNFPCNDPHCDLDLEDKLARELPEGSLYLRCDQLSVGTYQRPMPGSRDPKQHRTYQVMDARGQISVRGKDFTAQCDHLTFNEEKDQVIFIGERGNKAVMSKSTTKGAEPKIIRAKQITYIRSTGEFRIDEIGSIDG